VPDVCVLSFIGISHVHSVNQSRHACPMHDMKPVQMETTLRRPGHLSSYICESWCQESMLDSLRLQLARDDA